MVSTPNTLHHNDIVALFVKLSSHKLAVNTDLPKLPGIHFEKESVVKNVCGYLEITEGLTFN